MQLLNIEQARRVRAMRQGKGGERMSESHATKAENERLAKARKEQEKQAKRNADAMRKAFQR